MKSIVVNLHCTQCMYQTHKKSETLVMPEFEPEKRVELLNSLYFQKKCPCCTAVIQFIHPLLYVDKAHSFILMVKTKNSFKEEDNRICTKYSNMRKRYISDLKNIAEKICIFEDGFDDRVIEILKVKLYERAQRKKQKVKEITYRDVDKESSTIWFTIMYAQLCTMVAVTMHTYKQIQQCLPIEEGTYFEEINITWAITYLHENDTRLCYEY